MTTVQAILRKSGKALLIVLGFAVAALALLAAIHQITTVFEKASHPAPGRIVDVNGQRMHVYSEGNAGRTVVLLSGLGAACPSMDFRPLFSSLRADHRVVIAEGFGYGWSDLTNTPRTVQNIIAETRVALGKAGFSPPYVLMPHSVSGLYALYWVNAYPQEVEAVVGIDMTIPGQFTDYKYTKNTRWMDILANLGIIRAAIWLRPALAQVPQSSDNEYPAEDLERIRLMECWHIFNKTVVNENNLLPGNIDTVHGMRFPDTLPVLLFVSQGTADYVDESNWSKGWLEMQRDEIKNVRRGKAVMLPGHHFLHWNNSKRMAAEMHAFFSEM